MNVTEDLTKSVQSRLVAGLSGQMGLQLHLARTIIMRIKR